VSAATRGRFDQYTDAKQAMFFHTNSRWSPWMVIHSDDKAGTARRLSDRVQR
jgi:polyphosphate kinase 2 (PPK2 family)